MKFDKYQAAGNDFIVINGLERSGLDYNNLALKICDRHFGIGADGILVCEASDLGDIRMLYYNSDGSQGEMCGNGIRCFAKYIYDHDIVKKDNISIETLAGIKYVYIEVDKRGEAESIKVDMGYPLFESSKIPFALERGEVLKEEICIGGESYSFSAVNTGVPHLVIFVDDIDNYDIDSLGKKLESHSLFPQKTNVNFVEIIDRKNINIYTWERGASRTLGCGTGSCASVVIGNKLNLVDNRVDVKTEGGYLSVKIDEDWKIYMSGDAVHIGAGDFYLYSNI